MTFEEKQAEEQEIVNQIKQDANRIASTLWRGKINGVVYFVHERYSSRDGETWYTAHVGAANGPRVSNL